MDFFNILSETKTRAGKLMKRMNPYEYKLIKYFIRNVENPFDSSESDRYLAIAADVPVIVGELEQDIYIDDIRSNPRYDEAYKKMAIDFRTRFHKTTDNYFHRANVATMLKLDSSTLRNMEDGLSKSLV